MQLSVESTVDKKQIGIRYVTFWKLKLGKSASTFKMVGLIKFIFLVYDFTLIISPPFNNII